MTSRLNPYLNFAGETRAAMEFYQSVLGGELSMTTFGEFGMPDPAMTDRIMHAMLSTDADLTLMAADLPPNEQQNLGNNISLCLSGENADQLRGYWDKLSEGGTVGLPLEKQAWGDEFGMCVDRFGIPWMVNIG